MSGRRHGGPAKRKPPYEDARGLGKPKPKIAPDPGARQAAGRGRAKAGARAARRAARSRRRAPAPQRRGRAARAAARPPHGRGDRRDRRQARALSRRRAVLRAGQPHGPRPRLAHHRRRSRARPGRRRGRAGTRRSCAASGAPTWPPTCSRRSCSIAACGGASTRRCSAPPSRRATTASIRRWSRRDLTDLPTFTIDPVTARDFDDAISAQRLDGGATRIWVHIADVSAYVRPGSLIDREAARRGTSVYVPGRVEPMLPEPLPTRPARSCRSRSARR